jgi:uncharacterized protein YndB with AHSA1/START domain
MTDVQVETTVARPRAEVARYATDWRNDTEWIGALSEARLVTEPPFGVGSQVSRVGSFLGKRIEYVNEVVELDPERRLVMRSVKAPFPMAVTYEFEDADGGTLMRIRAQGDASGFYRLAGPALSRAVKRGIKSDLARLKQRLET